MMIFLIGIVLIVPVEKSYVEACAAAVCLVTV